MNFSEEENKMPAYRVLLSIIICLSILAIFAVFVVTAYAILKNSSLLRLGGIIEITPFPCVKTYPQQGIATGQQKSEEGEKENTELCLSATEVIGLNNSIKLSESIALLGVFVAIVGVLLPILGFFSIKHQRVSMEDAFNKKFLQLRDELNIKTKNFIDNLPHRFLEASNFRRVYLVSRFRAISKSSDISSFQSIFSDAFQLEAALTNICLTDDVGVKRNFAEISDFIDPEDVKNNEDYVKKLREVLEYFYQTGVFDSDAKRKALKDFIESRLKTKLS
jgi:hypothetical protein